MRITPRQTKYVKEFLAIQFRPTGMADEAWERSLMNILKDAPVKQWWGDYQSFIKRGKTDEDWQKECLRIRNRSGL